MATATRNSPPPLLGTSYPATAVARLRDGMPGTETPGPAEQHRYRAARTWVVVRGARRPRALAPAGVWLATGTPIGDPYPCRCATDRCTGDGHCPCWGQPVHDGVPAGCCRHLPASRALAEWTPDDLNSPEATAPVVAPMPVVAAAAGFRRDSATGELAAVVAPLRPSDPLPAGDDEQVERSFALLASDAKARIAAGGWQCTCPTPWDGKKKTSGHHCPECHTNWSSYGLASMHRRDGRCMPPSSIVDVSTGHPLVHVIRVGGFDVWCKAPLSAAGRPAFRYE